MAVMMGDLIQAHVKDKGLRSWIMPGFTTTTETDVVVASVIMMAQLQRYFTYQFSPIMCGLPSVALLGEKSDWEEIERRLEKLAEFGEEPTQWMGLLKPVLKRIAMSFDDPQGQEVLLFWNRIAHYASMGSGSDGYSGWITAFCFWDDDGKCLYSQSYVKFFGLERAKEMAATTKWQQGREVLLCMDDVFYHEIDTQMVPTGYASVPVQLCPMGSQPGFPCVMIAGSVGVEVTDIGIPKVTAPDRGTKPLGSEPRGRSKWESFTSSLITICQFRTSRASSPPESTTVGLKKMPASSIEAGKRAGVKSDVEAPKSPERKKGTKATMIPEVEKDVSPQVSPESTSKADTRTAVESATSNLVTKKAPQLSNAIDTDNLEIDIANIGGGTSQRSSVVFSYDPATESFWTASTVAGKQTTTAPSEPTVRDEEDEVNEADEVDEATDVANSATLRRTLQEKGAKDKMAKTRKGRKGPMDTVSPVTGWWIYQKKE